MCAPFVGRFNFLLILRLWHSAGGAALGLNCVAGWEPLAGVFASGGALPHIVFNLLWLAAAIDTEPDFYHQVLALFYLHYSTSSMPQTSPWSDLRIWTSAKSGFLWFISLGIKQGQVFSQTCFKVNKNDLGAQMLEKVVQVLPDTCCESRQIILLFVQVTKTGGFFWFQLGYHDIV